MGLGRERIAEIRAPERHGLEQRPAQDTGGKVLEDLDRRIITALQQNGRATWTEVSRAVGVSSAKAGQRAGVLFANRVLGVSVVSALEFSPAPSDLYEVRLRCRSGRQREVARALMQRRDTRWVAILGGEHDIAAELLVPRGGDIATVLIDSVQFHPDVLDIRSALVLHTFKVSQSWNRGLLGPAEHLHLCDPSHLTSVDRSILAALKVDGRRSCASVATEIRADESTVRRRLQRMLRRGCAQAMTIVQPSSLGYEHEVLLELEVLPAHLEAAATELKNQPGIRYLAATFASRSLVCEVVMPDAAALYDFLNRVIGGLLGVTGMVASVELLVVKRSFLICPWVK